MFAEYMGNVYIRVILIYNTRYDQREFHQDL